MANPYGTLGKTPGSPLAGKPPSFLAQSRGEVQRRFVDLEWAQRERLAQGIQAPATSANPSQWSRLSGEEIARRNRYRDIDVFHSNRVRLRVNDEVKESDYINASPITLHCLSGAEKRYIATQGPKETSSAHFYMMLWHEVSDPAVVVMLTQTHEAGREKCFQYYPTKSSTGLPQRSSEEEAAKETSDEERASDQDAKGKHSNISSSSSTSSGSGRSSPGRNILEFESGSFRAAVELVSSDYDHQTRSTIRKLKMSVGTESKTIFHYLFEGWPDFGIPEGENRTALLELLNVTAAKADTAPPLPNVPQNPRVVHCSAGVGRSGTFIALDYLLSELAEGSFDEDYMGSDKDHIADCVDELRKQRMMMVQGESQYHFLYDVVYSRWAERSTGAQQPSSKRHRA